MLVPAGSREVNHGWLDKLNLFLAAFLGVVVAGVVLSRIIPYHPPAPLLTKAESAEAKLQSTVPHDSKASQLSDKQLNDIYKTFNNSSDIHYLGPEADIIPGESSNFATQPTNKQSQTAYPSFQYKSAESKEHKLARLLREPINVNNATVIELDDLPGIGPTLAQRIIDYRRAHGPFKSINELINVKGIGPKKLAGMRPYVILH